MSRIYGMMESSFEAGTFVVTIFLHTGDDIREYFNHFVVSHHHLCKEKRQKVLRKFLLASSKIKTFTILDIDLGFDNPRVIPIVLKF
jgi:hypothetical protein